MIARIWHGVARAGHADAYEAMLKPEPLPGLSRMAGYCGSTVLRRPLGEETEFITILYWDSVDAIRAVAGEDYEHAVVPEERRQHLARWDERAAHYEVRGDRLEVTGWRGQGE